MTLPDLQITYSCGACGGELENDGGTYRCFDCGLDYHGDPAGRPEAEFAENTNPCDVSGPATRRHRTPFRIADGVTQEWRTTTTATEPCSLPSDHAGNHYHHTVRAYTYDTETLN